MNSGGAGTHATVASAPPWIADYAELTKPRVTALILMSTLVGFYLGSPAEINFPLLFHTLLGTALVAGGTAALNQFWEREPDGKMLRTKDRPLPAGRMEPWKALSFGLVFSVAGILYLITAVSFLTALLASLTLAAYLFVYTPLKKRTPLCTLVGAFPGAIPPLIGYVGASGDFTLGSGILYLILFLWQFPHFLSIAWLYREDYARAGIVMLPVVEPDGKATGRQILVYCAMLLPASLLPSLVGEMGWIYFGGAFVLSAIFLHYGIRAATARTKVQARRLLQASVVYLPLVYGLMMVDKMIR